MDTPPRRESAAFTLSDDERQSMGQFSFPSSPVSQTSPASSHHFDDFGSNELKNSPFDKSKNDTNKSLILNDRRRSIHRRQQQPISFTTYGPFLGHDITKYNHGASGIGINSASFEESVAKQQFMTNDIILNTQNQIRRNSASNYQSLFEFARCNNIDMSNKKFVSCPESGDVDNNSKIDINVPNCDIYDCYKDE
ncbi:hypothetical protein TPHA_0L01440 [Tetrapisispora phaffii CBS 4417]|uniref:Uncharacterized protein n=1 Tax=Tetrapisispora phaffii (strain ATCC 24235 / CBS 4417 / NBRC 1672 / NRRL Y-8282 / UCD 70-5) TaxID=1071381 RepID=G8C021_TETPH|nr:hypothetical protein TPHA_0L01440 [Tetrapisispora phaffii CBS 4417]CCE65499.1 hypothetical protein TPHA_0L01440 [Tetrapisispora phaffii CBS 4417]